MSATTEQYEGWRNRETWAVQLWLSNDEGLYRAMIRRLDLAKATGWPLTAQRAGEEARTLWQEITEPTYPIEDAFGFVKTVLPMLQDTGSSWRVDWGEVGEHWLEA
jgi:hypothetical protein